MRNGGLLLTSAVVPEGLSTGLFDIISTIRHRDTNSRRWVCLRRIRATISIRSKKCRARGDAVARNLYISPKFHVSLENLRRLGIRREWRLRGLTFQSLCHLLTSGLCFPIFYSPVALVRHNRIHQRPLAQRMMKSDISSRGDTGHQTVACMRRIQKEAGRSPS